MPLLYFAEPSRTMNEPWFVSNSSMDDFMPQSLLRHNALRAQARAEARAERARRQRRENQRREAIAARVLAIEAARQQVMQEEYERRQRKAIMIRQKQQQERQRQEQERLRAIQLEKQRQRAFQLETQRQRAIQQRTALLRRYHGFDSDDWPFGRHFLPSGLEQILDELFEHHEPIPDFEVHLTLDDGPTQAKEPQDQQLQQGTSQHAIETRSTPEPTQEPVLDTEPAQALAKLSAADAEPVSEPTTAEQPAPAASNASEAQAQSQDQTKSSEDTQATQTQRQTLFFHPFSSDLAQDSSKVDASQIHVDIKGNRVTVSGLWSLDLPRSPSLSPRSKARAAHVRDVDENGEEILLPHDTDDSDSDSNSDSVGSERDTCTSSTISKTIELPTGITADQLQADLNDEGFFLRTV